MTGKSKGEKPRAYLLKGDDEFRKREHLNALLASLVTGDFADFDLEQMDGDSATSDRIMAGLNVPPFASEQRVVLVRYANKIHEDEQQKLALHIPKIPPTGCLVIVNPAPEKSEGKPKKGSEVIGDLSRAVRKAGDVKEFGGGPKKEQQAEAREFARSLFEKAGKKIDAGALAIFLLRVGTDFAVVSTEARKVIDYSGDSEKIMKEDVSAVTSETPEEKVFKLVDAIAAKNQADALRFMGELFEAGDNPSADAPRTLANIARQFRMIWQVKLLQEAGVRSLSKAAVPENVQSMLPSEPNVLELVARQSWQADRLTRQARSFSLPELARNFGSIARADAMLKGIEGEIEDPALVMELLVFDLCGVRK